MSKVLNCLILDDVIAGDIPTGIIESYNEDRSFNSFKSLEYDNYFNDSNETELDILLSILLDFSKGDISNI